jgi:hypothetical protein
VFVLVLQDISTRMCENKVRRGMRTSTLKDKIIAL